MVGTMGTMVLDWADRWHGWLVRRLICVAKNPSRGVFGGRGGPASSLVRAVPRTAVVACWRVGKPPSRLCCMCEACPDRSSLLYILSVPRRHRLPQPGPLGRLGRRVGRVDFYCSYVH